MKSISKMSAAGALGLAFALMWGPAASAQNPASGSPPAATGPKPAGTTSPGSSIVPGGQDSDNLAAPAGAVDPYAGTLKEVGTGLPLLGTSSTPLRWGDFSISRLEYLGLRNDFQPSGSGAHTITNASLFRTGLMFDHTFRYSRLVLEYLPELAIINGTVSKGASSNNSFEVGTSIPISGRMSLTLQDSFLQNQANQLIPQNYLATNWSAGAVSQNNFLNNNGNFLSDTASASVQYAFSPRTSMVVTPFFTYARSSFNGSSSGSATQGQIYGATASLSRALSPYRRVGVAESYEYARELAGISNGVRYATSSVFYSQQVSRYWWITGTAGASHQNSSNQSNPTDWAFSGGGTITGSISNSVGLSLAYTRAVMFNNYVSTQQADRADAAIDLHVISRLRWSNGIGYYREVGPSPRNTGKYAGASLSFNLFGDIYLFGAFVHTYQSTSTQQLLSGIQDTAAFGIRWEPPAIPRR